MVSVKAEVKAVLVCWEGRGEVRKVGMGWVWWMWMGVVGWGMVKRMRAGVVVDIVGVCIV